MVIPSIPSTVHIYTRHVALSTVYIMCEWRNVYTYTCRLELRGRFAHALMCVHTHFHIMWISGSLRKTGTDKGI